MPKARARIPIYVEGPDGRPLAGAQVYIRTDPGGADATIYSGRTGAGTLPNPQTSGADGRVPGYLDRNDYAATVTRPLMDPYVEAFEAAPGAADAIDADWIDDDATGAGYVAVRQADGSVSWVAPGVAGQPPVIVAPAALPAAPVLGQRVTYVAVPAKGIAWDLVCTNPAGAVGQRWSVVGGSPLRAAVSVAAATASTAGTGWVNLGTEVLIADVPLPGDYDVTHGLRADLNNQAAQLLVSVYKNGAAIGEMIDFRTPNTGGGGVHHTGTLDQTLTLAALDDLALRYNWSSGSASVATVYHRWLSAMPVRV